MTLSLRSRTRKTLHGTSTTVSEPSTDFDFADDVALLTEMLSVLVLAHAAKNHKAKSLGLQVNWMKTKIQTTNSSSPPPGSLVPVADDNVEVVEFFTPLLYSYGYGCDQRNREFTCRPT